MQQQDATESERHGNMGNAVNQAETPAMRRTDRTKEVKMDEAAAPLLEILYCQLNEETTTVATSSCFCMR